jgi:uncharacterized protein
MKRATTLLIIVFILETAFFFYNETNGIVLHTKVIQDKALSEAFERLRVMQISDLHIKWIGYREKRLAKLIEDVDPDLIFITGDFISSNAGIDPCVKFVGSIAKRRLVIAVLGNSDHSINFENVDTGLLVKGLSDAGVKLLLNSNLQIRISNKGGRPRLVTILGVDDNFLMLDDIYKAEENSVIASPVILLAHAPNIVDQIDVSKINLILSGHTHGGQIVLPFFGALSANSPAYARRIYLSGLYKTGTNLFVTKGVGTSVIPIRFYCKPEAVMFEFK